MRKLFGYTLLVLGAVPAFLLGPETIIWAIHECPYAPSNCHPIPYRVIINLIVCLAVALTGLALVIGWPRFAKNSN